MSNDVLGQSNVIASSLRFSEGKLFVAESAGLWIPRGGIYENVDVPVNSIMYVTNSPANLVRKRMIS